MIGLSSQELQPNITSVATQETIYVAMLSNNASFFQQAFAEMVKVGKVGLFLV